MLEPLILFAAGFVAAAISGAAGFGGALLLLPLLVAAVGPEHAVPLLTIAQLIGNLSRAGFGFAKIQWKPVGLFLVGAVPFSVLGAFSFIQVPRDFMTRLIGVAILMFVSLRALGFLRLRAGPKSLAAMGSVVGFLSGLIGSAGPLGAAIFLSLGLPPVAYVASEAMTALAMHSVKMLVYGQYIALDREFWGKVLLLGAAMILGTFVANRMIQRLPRDRFQSYVAILLALIAVYMVAHG